MAGTDPGAFMSHVPGAIPVIKPIPGDLVLLGGEHSTLSPLNCFLGLEAELSVSPLGVEVASAPTLLSLEAGPVLWYCNTPDASPTRDSLLGGPGVATELLTLILLLL